MYFLKLNDNNFEFNIQNKCTISDIAIQEEKHSFCLMLLPLSVYTSLSTRIKQDMKNTKKVEFYSYR